jgi:CrcB protein
MLFIAAGGSLGAIARFGVSSAVYQLTSESFPWGTLVVNISGSFLIGVAVELFDGTIIPSEWRSFITIGFLGSYTTFSTFSLETVNLLRDGELPLATGNILASNVVSVLFVVLGIYSSRLLLRLFA